MHDTVKDTPLTSRKVRVAVAALAITCWPLPAVAARDKSGGGTGSAGNGGSGGGSTGGGAIVVGGVQDGNFHRHRHRVQARIARFNNAGGLRLLPSCEHIDKLDLRP